VSQVAEEAADAPRIAWRWLAALLGALCAVPAAVVTVQDPALGLALAFGAIPAAAVGIPAERRNRHLIIVIGACIGLSLALGAVLVSNWLLAVVGILGLCLGAAVLSGRRPAGGCSWSSPCRWWSSPCRWSAPD
jgi:hypothetical protein